jgi:hypothetical protein
MRATAALAPVRKMRFMLQLCATGLSTSKRVTTNDRAVWDITHFRHRVESGARGGASPSRARGANARAAELFIRARGDDEVTSQRVVEGETAGRD